MVYAVNGFFGFRNAARRDGVMQNVQTRLTQEITWGETITQAIDPSPRLPDPSMSIEVRFPTEYERNTFWDDVVAFMGTGANGPVVGSYIAKHNCRHDESYSPGCVIQERIDY
jgi:hypothetical protein